MTRGSELPPIARVPIAGLLAWLVPGLGHLFIGERVRGWVCLITIAVTFWGGVAIGGVHETVNPQQRKAWFLAQSCTGGHALVAYFWARRLPDDPLAHWQSVETAVVYSGVAGLLNLLVILDVLGRADSPVTVAGGATAAGGAGARRGQRGGP